MTIVKLQSRLATIAVVLAFFVVLLGAYTRLTDAGLGCPDWPGCYGRMVAPIHTSTHQSLFVEPRKAWTEMIHRYAAGTLAVLILSVAGLALYRRKHLQSSPWIVAVLLVGLVIFQALLGMWTVTLKLFPIVVMGHLLGGVGIFSGLCYFRWQLSEVRSSFPQSKEHIWVRIAVLIVFLQIALGGWVSANYAGLACIGFPGCAGVHGWPTLHLGSAFNGVHAFGANHQGGLLDSQSRLTIQWIHRLGAYVTLSYVIGLALWILRYSFASRVRLIALLCLILVCIQFLLGIINVVYLLPLWASVAHNAVAVLLLGAMVSLFYLTSARGEHHASAY